MDPLSFILIVLVGVLAIFMVVRIAKYASRTVDKEQKNEHGLSDRPASDAQPVSGIPSQAPATKSKELRLGVTAIEVESALGLPETKADLGEKVLYRYAGITAWSFAAGRLHMCGEACTCIPNSRGGRYAPPVTKSWKGNRHGYDF